MYTLVALLACHPTPRPADTDPRVIADRIWLGESKTLDTCYQHRKAEVPTIHGTWEVAFTIGTSGEPGDVKVTAIGAPDAAIEACISERVSGWGFEARDAPIDVHHTVSW